MATPHDLELERRAHAEVLSIVSHDIRAPLGVILGAVSELLNPQLGKLDDEQRALLQLVRRSGEKLSRLAANVLFMNRVAIDRVALQRQRVDARDVVRRAIESFEKAGELGRIRVIPTLPTERVDADLDAERAMHALVNVIANALRFAREEVRVQVESDDAGGARFVVDDDGPGVPAAQEPLLFDQDARLKSDASPVTRGLGLIVAKAIMDGHAGAIRIEAPAGPAGRSGARFVLVFPR